MGGVSDKEGGMKIKVVLEPAEEGGYTAYVPSLPGCISEGDTCEEAVELYLFDDKAQHIENIFLA